MTEVMIAATIPIVVVKVPTVKSVVSIVAKSATLAESALALVLFVLIAKKLATSQESAPNLVVNPRAKDAVMIMVVVVTETDTKIVPAAEIPVRDLAQDAVNNVKVVVPRLMRQLRENVTTRNLSRNPRALLEREVEVKVWIA